MIYYLFIITLCVSTMAYCMDRKQIISDASHQVIPAGTTLIIIDGKTVVDTRNTHKPSPAAGKAYTQETTPKAPAIDHASVDQAARIKARRQEIARQTIQELLKMRTGQGNIGIGSYSISNDNGLISEERENPTTGLNEERNFTPDDIAQYSFDHPRLPVDIILKK